MPTDPKPEPNVTWYALWPKLDGFFWGLVPPFHWFWWKYLWVKKSRTPYSCL